jgi:cytochrome c peroxidase
MCHSGGALSSMNFYALGMADLRGPGVLGPVPESLGRGGFLQDPDEYYRFKMPQLYNLADSPFHGHGGTFQSIREVVEYYNQGIPDVAVPDHILAASFQPLELTEQEIADLTLFLEKSLRDPNLKRYVPDSLPSGNCFPANDPAARRDLSCE